MDAHVHRHRGEWFVSLRKNGVEVEDAGPFDSEYDANEAGLRAIYGDGEFFPCPVILPEINPYTDPLRRAA